ncbi:DUF7948 domain-containing protein [Ferruginibacter sp.]|nr:T9SS type B sorting domain-containing protein [Ferruginibacter sp.]
MKIFYFKRLLLQHILTTAFLCCGAFVCGQIQHKSISSLQQTFNSSCSFIENKGQYGKLLKGYESMDIIIYGYEGLSMPVLFTKKGVIHLQRKVGNKVLEEGQTTEKENVTDRVITMQWVDANTNVEIIKEEKTFDYHTYGLLEQKAYGYKKIIYKNLYNGIDLIYSFTNNTKQPGFEYYLQVRPGAAIKAVKMKYGGDVKAITKNQNGNLIITSDIGGVEETIPVSYYKTNAASDKKAAIKTEYKIDKKEVSFSFLQGYDKNKEIIIDPFVSSTGNLDGTNAGKAKDIDFDYEGNVYVTGGGDVTTNHRLAKYNANGILLWTFNGVLTTPAWEFGYYNGGWVVEKGNGKIYLGQGTSTGSRAFIRLNTNGVYDNYIVGSTNFFNMWKMFWNCNNGTPEILVGGGGTSTNTCLMKFTPSVFLFTFTGITGSFQTQQNVADFLIDPVNNDMYSIFTCINGTPVNNGIYKNAKPYNSGTVSWYTPSGYTTLSQEKNRPYLVTNANDNNDNSANILALNATYLFYWDGKNLKAFNKTTGAVAGTPLTTANTALMQGGIFADACNNVFVGEINGTIKVYNFNGSSFNDAPVDITIPGYTTNAVYDLIYDESKQLLYACGDGFVASFDITFYCSTNNSFFSLNVVPNCNTASVAASLTPAPPAGTVVTYSLYTANTLIASNTTGTFTGLQLLTNYKIIATLNAVCSGIQVSGIFTLPTPAIATTVSNTSCGNNNGQIIALGSGSTAPYTYSIDGVNFFTNGTFTGLAANTYTVIVKDATGCSNTSVPLVIANSTGVNVTAALTSNTTCGFANGAITATGIGGIAPLAYSIDGGATYQLSNSFTGLAANTYTVTVKDAIGCTKSSTPVIIGASSSVSITATSVNAICGFINGSITATGIGGVAPLMYSIDGGANYQSSPNFNGLPAATYIVTVKDAGNCTSVTAPIIITSTTSLTVSALPTNAVCGFANGSISVTVSGGTAPYQYSIDGGVTYQTANIFNALAASAYSIIVRDVNNCNNSAAAVVANTPIHVLNVFAGNDTLVGINEPLQLNAIDINNTGFVKYEWSPSFGLNNNQLKNPVAILDKDFTYTLLATTSGGCKAEDKINIKISLSSQIYVPNAFTPNGDGNNDIIKPGLVGIRELKYYAIYNRYGQLVFKTASKNEGWDGLINGKPQHTGSYVWVAEGIDYTGKTIFRKGTTILIK